MATYTAPPTIDCQVILSFLELYSVCASRV